MIVLAGGGFGELGWAALVATTFVLGLYNLILLAVKREKRYFSRFLAFGAVCAVAFAAASLLHAPPRDFSRSGGQGQLTSCKSNLESISEGIGRYSVDQAETLYPAALSALTPSYLKAVPSCPAAGTATYAYQSASAPGAYTIWCQGHYHEKDGLAPNYPQYTSVLGVVER